MRNENEDHLIGIGEAARILGVCRETLKGWDKKGILAPVRTAGNHRRYHASEVRKIQAKGF